MCSSHTRSVIHFRSSGLTKNGGRASMLQQWPPQGVDGVLLCHVVLAFMTRWSSIWFSSDKWSPLICFVINKHYWDWQHCWCLGGWIRFPIPQWRYSSSLGHRISYHSDCSDMGPSCFCSKRAEKEASGWDTGDSSHLCFSQCPRQGELCILLYSCVSLQWFDLL